MFRVSFLKKFSETLFQLNKCDTFVGRQIHNGSSYCIEELKLRKLIRVAGNDSSEFLQGLITNDMANLSSSMYTMFLNNKGRILFDSIIYSTKEEGTFLVECDSEALEQLVKHMKIYKLKKKVDISPVDSEYAVWCVYKPNYVDLISEESSGEQLKSIPEVKFEPGCLNNDNNLLVAPDPRTSLLGIRLIIRKGENVPILPKHDLYQTLRYKLGIGEGMEELSYGQSFPLEMNCDYLQGVSFSKGCYLGQELTARIFHTGVVRKRLMPLVFDSELCGVPVNTPIEDSTVSRKSPIGKLKASKGLNGLGLMRVSDTIDSKSLKLLNVTARSYVPCWWPKESVQEHYFKAKQ